MEKLLKLLEENKKIPMHMPGHKRNVMLADYLKRLGADLDITEIDGFDNLHNAGGILKQSMEKAAALRGADRAFYLINGTTAGILAAVCAVVSRGDKVVVARNCHKSVYNAVELAGAEPIFILPKQDDENGIVGPIEYTDLENTLSMNENVKLVIITSPTYEGVVSDIGTISRICHEYDIPLLVDSAHGAHLGFGYGFQDSATTLGADIAVESLHKTLPSLTQTAICYCKNAFAEKIAEKLAIFETSSPSYLLMASIDGCIRLIEERGDKLFSAWKKRLDNLYSSCAELKNITLWDGGKFEKDPSKIVLLGENGLFDALRRRQVECEMSLPGYTLAMTGMGDTDEMMARFIECLFSVDKEITAKKKPAIPQMHLPQKKLSVYDAGVCETEAVSNALGRISAGYIWAYPPGIPLVVPGEVIEKEEIEIFSEYKSAGIDLFCTRKCESGKILVVK